MITTFPSSACLCQLKECQQGSHSETAAADYACMDALCIAAVDSKSRQVKFEPGNITPSTGEATAGGLSGRMGEVEMLSSRREWYGQINGFVRLFGMTRSPRWGQSPVHQRRRNHGRQNAGVKIKTLLNCGVSFRK